MDAQSFQIPLITPTKKPRRTITAKPMKVQKRVNSKLGAPLDPSRDQLFHQLLQVIANIPAKLVVEGTEKDNKGKRPVSTTTIYNWRKSPKDGGTRHPQAYTMDRVLRVHGKKLGIMSLD